MVCLRQLLRSTQTSRLEPLFVPDNIDFTLSLGRDQRFDFPSSLGRDRRYTALGSESFWVPRYRSNLEEEYERPGKAIFDRVELTRIHKKYFICFKEACDEPHDPVREPVREEGTNHPGTPNSWNKDLQHFLNTLTGWNLLVIFVASDVRRKTRTYSLNRRPTPRLADVLCFQKLGETRIAIRRKDAEYETIDWTTAELVEINVDTSIERLTLKLESRQTGTKLALATVTAADVETNNDTDKTETWHITVASGSGELRTVIRGNAAS